MQKEIIIKELEFKASRSSGAGGQHVNKVSSKVAVMFHVQNSSGLSNEEKEQLQIKLKNRLNKEGQLVLFCEESRSQHKNKELVVDKLFQVINEALKQKKPRKATKPSKSSVEKRIQKKKIKSVKKILRAKPKFE